MANCEGWTAVDFSYSTEMMNFIIESEASLADNKPVKIREMNAKRSPYVAMKHDLRSIF